MAYKKSDIMRERILNESKILFYENGYEKTTMRQIAKACDIHQSLLYYYYLNKNALASEIMQNFSDRVEKVLDEYLEYKQLPVLYLLSLVRLLAKELSKDPKELQFYCEIFDNPVCDRPFMERLHNAISLYNNDPDFDKQKTIISVIIGDRVWAGLVKEMNSGKLDIELRDVINIADIERYLYLGLSHKEINNLIGIAEGIVDNIPISGIKIIN